MADEHLLRSVGLLPVRCVICGLPLGNAMLVASQWLAKSERNGNLREEMLKCGLGSERICCRDAILSRPGTLQMLASVCLGASVTSVQHPSPAVRAWLNDVGPYFYYKKALHELLNALLQEEALAIHNLKKNRRYESIGVRPTHASQPHMSSSGTLSVLLMGDLIIKDFEGKVKQLRGVQLGRVPVPSSRRPLEIRNRMRAPIMRATAKRNHITAILTEKFDKKCVRVIVLGTDPRGLVPEMWRPNTVPTELIIENGVTNYICAEAEAIGVPRIKVMLPANTPQDTIFADDNFDDDDNADVAEDNSEEEPEAELSIADENLQEQHAQQVADEQESFRIPSKKVHVFSLGRCVHLLAKKVGCKAVKKWCLDVARSESIVDSREFHVMLQWALIQNLQECAKDADKGVPSVENAFPWVRAVSGNQVQQLWSILRQLLRMSVHGLEVYWKRRVADDPRANQDFEGTAYSLITETIVGIRLAIIRGSKYLSDDGQNLDERTFDCRPDMPIDVVGDKIVATPQDLVEALAHYPRSCVSKEGGHEIAIQQDDRIFWNFDVGCAMLVTKTPVDKCIDEINRCMLGYLEKIWRNTCNIERVDIQTLRRRPKIVTRDVSKDIGFATILDRPVSSHDINSRPHQPRDDGFIDGRDTTDVNPGQRGFMCVGTVLSCRVPWKVLLEVAERVKEAMKCMDEEDASAVYSRRVMRLFVNGVPYYVMKDISKQNRLEHMCRAVLRSEATKDPRLHEASVEMTLAGVNINGFPDRLLRPVQLIKWQRESSFLELLNNGVVKWMGQDEQAAWVIRSSPIDEKDNDVRRIAWELDTELRCGYRVLKIPQRVNGHPSRLHYFIKLAARAASSAPLIPGKGRRFVGISNLSEGAVTADPYSLGTCDDNQEGLAMAIAWGCAGGANHEDSLATSKHALRSQGVLYKEIELVRIKKDQFSTLLLRRQLESNFDKRNIGEDGLPYGYVETGQPLAVFRKAADKSFGACTKRILESKNLQDIWVSPEDGIVVAAREYTNRIEVVLRQKLEQTDGSKIGFPFQKMTITTQWRSLCGSWLDISAVSHPTSMLSRQSAGLILLGLRNLEACGRCISPSLQEDDAGLRTAQRDSSQIFWDMVDCPDIPHHAAGPVFDDATGRLQGQNLVVILRASQAASHNPQQAMSGRCDDNVDGRGPRQEPLLRMLLSSLGYNIVTEEHSPSAIWSGCEHRLHKLEVCKRCKTVTCACKNYSKTQLMVPEQLKLADDLARQQHMQIKYVKGRPVPIIAGLGKKHRGTPATARQLQRAALRACRPSRAPTCRGTLEVQASAIEEEMIACLRGRGARVLGRILLTQMQDNTTNPVVAVEDIEERCNQNPFEYKFRLLTELKATPAENLHVLLDGVKCFQEEIQELEKTVDIQWHGVLRVEFKKTSRLAVNLVRLYARDLLPVKHFVLSENQENRFRSRKSGRLVPFVPVDHPDVSQADLWQEAHYEATALAETLQAVPIDESVPAGTCTLEIPRKKGDNVVNAGDLVLNKGDVRLSKDTDLVILPVPPDAGVSRQSVIISGSIDVLSPVEGAPFSALPHARINNKWVVEADVEVLSACPCEKSRLLDGNVCHRNLLGEASKVLEKARAEGKKKIRLVEERCDGCGACVHLADHMPVLRNIEDLSVCDRTNEKTRLPLRGTLTLRADASVTVLECSTGTRNSTACDVLRRAANAILYDWSARSPL